MKLLQEDLQSVEFEEIRDVRNKEILKLKVKNPMKVSYLKDIIRGLFIKSGIGIRARIDVGEDNWIGKDYVYGTTLVVVRTKKKLSNEEFSKVKEILIDDSGLSVNLDILDRESVDVHSFRNIVEKYNRSVHKAILDVKTELFYEMSESRGRWRQPVMESQGDIVNVLVDGSIRVVVRELDSESSIYEVLVDAPYGLNVYTILEQEFGFRKGSLKDYPVESLLVYEGVDEKKNHLGRRKCPLYGTSIERTVGGLVGDKSVKGLMIGKEVEVIEGKIKL